MAAKPAKKESSRTTPKFPYTNKPGSLRKVLKDIPKKPKPTKFNFELLKSWGYRDTNDQSVVRVFKAVNLLSASGEPTEVYTQFMNLDGGARALGTEVKRLYAPLFNAAHAPYDESAEKLKNLFHIHSGGGERVLEYQMQTFKALCESASFDAQQTFAAAATSTGAATKTSGTSAANTAATGQPTVNINLHIHLPENKTRRDYTDIIEDIGRYIFGRANGDRRRE
jgi:hypothetical protein